MVCNTLEIESVCIWIKIIYTTVNWFNAEIRGKKYLSIFLTLYSNMEYHLTPQYVYIHTY